EHQRESKCQHSSQCEREPERQSERVQGSSAHFAAGPHRGSPVGAKAPGTDSAAPAEAGSGIPEGPAEAVSAATTTATAATENPAAECRRCQTATNPAEAT